MKKYFKEIRFHIFMRVLCYGFVTLATAAIPALQKQLFDLILGEEAIIDSFPVIIVTYVVCLLSASLFGYLSMLYTWKASLRFELSLKRDFFKSVFNYKYEDFASRDIGEYISIQGNDITALDMDYLTPLVDIIQAFIQILIFGVFLFVNVDWRISTVILIGSILTIIIPKVTSKPLADKRNTWLNQMGKYVSRIKDFLEGFKLIQSRTRNNINKEHEKILEETKNMRYKYGKFKSLTFALENLGLNIVSAVAFIIAAILLLNGDLTMGSCVAAFGYINSFISPINDLMYDFNSVSSLKKTKEKVIAYLEKEINQDLKVKKKFNQNITFENISFRYDNFSLDNFSYEFVKGKKYALIGHNGSGKSTLINGLMNYITPISGRIDIDGENIDSIDTAHIMYCLNQNEHIFSDSFINNATVFSSYQESSLNRVTDNLRLKIIDNLKTQDNSQNLSGGEKQVLSIIRMLTSSTEICLMDEPFAAVDSKTTEILENMLMDLQDKTIIMVTHDLSENLAKFDEILLMEKGKVIGKGTYKEISEKQEFKKLIKTYLH
ncbi:ABC transporter ATP-binding protein [Vallitalea longa]|uniref:ABC transporter ATP-binding protein n=1 Tax=Vallitalea longa TaxID=2936439 RepID=A0A9W5YIN8_9FIRM|nr:ABC transporter ATP-binding protein [Vallitalea longa]GKX32023.1 ABC transporter ATP-binding protein [Vallitalea longa]